MINKGFENEKNIVDYLYLKHYSEVNELWSYYLKFLFPWVKYYDTIAAKRATGHLKSDLVISINGNHRYVSVKSGNKCSIHTEQLSSFYTYLKEVNVSDETIQTIDKFLLKEEDFISSETYSNAILKANFELNTPNIRRAILVRCLLKGRYKNTKWIHALFYGNSEHGVMADANELVAFMSEYKNIENTNTLKVGPFLIQRYNKKNQDIRYIQFKWLSIKEDLIAIHKKRINSKN